MTMKLLIQALAKLLFGITFLIFLAYPFIIAKRGAPPWGAFLFAVRPSKMCYDRVDFYMKV